jgi:DNA-nicking Smr family endonuclease
VTKRTLKDSEKRLWAEVARSIAPLRPSASIQALETGQEPAAAADHAAKGNAEPEGAAPAEKAARPPRHRPPAVTSDLDRKTRKKLARGTLPIEARIDLHGMTEDQAHRALVRFIGGAVSARRRMVLVITGKGSGGEGRGILRRNVPHWLEGRELSRHVVSYGAAHPTHGGDGALYVRLRVGHHAGR